MKNKYSVYIVSTLFITFAAYLVVPALLDKIFYKSSFPPFVTYSSVMEKLCRINFTDEEAPLKDFDGTVYPESQYDSLFPFINYRQLVLENRFPDSVGGVPVTLEMVKQQNFFFRQGPADFSSPEPGLYLLFESASGKVDLETPQDVFRIGDRIEFIDPVENEVDAEKSERFNAALVKAGFTFPAGKVYGNMDPRKAYDQGVFLLDADREFFHLVMVKGEPFVRNTHLSDRIDILEFAMSEQNNRRAYGFLYGTDGSCYLVERDPEHEGTYAPRKVDIGPVDIYKEDFHIMGNPLYWTYSIHGEEGSRYCALRTSDLVKVEEEQILLEEQLWEKIAKVLFPFRVSFVSPYSDYLRPSVTFTSWAAWGLNLVLALLVLVIFRKRSRPVKVYDSVFVLFFGVLGLLSVLLAPRCIK